jgi:hypothetical protein
LRQSTWICGYKSRVSPTTFKILTQKCQPLLPFLPDNPPNKKSMIFALFKVSRDPFVTSKIVQKVNKLMKTRSRSYKPDKQQSRLNPKFLLRYAPCDTYNFILFNFKFKIAFLAWKMYILVQMITVNCIWKHVFSIWKHVFIVSVFIVHKNCCHLWPVHLYDSHFGCFWHFQMIWQHQMTC